MQRLDERRGSDGVAEPETGQRIGLRERARHEDVRQGQREIGAVFRREIGIGLVDQHHAAERAAEIRNGGLCEQQAGRCVRIREEEQVGMIRGRGDPTEVVRQRQRPRGHVLDRGKHRIERIRRIEIADGAGTFHEAAGAESEHLVRAVADEHMLRRAAVQRGDEGAHRGGNRLGIETQAFRVERAQRREGGGRRRVRVLVRVKFDDLRVLRLFAGNVGVQFGDGFSDHNDSPRVRERGAGAQHEPRLSGERAFPSLETAPRDLISRNGSARSGRGPPVFRPRRTPRSRAARPAGRRA